MPYPQLATGNCKWYA
jgi:NADH-quinone oxidoreductase subunit I